MKTRVLAAMSGGVDSSVAAALLVERGFEVVGVTMKLLPRAETGFGCCGSPSDVEDAKRVCDGLGISHYTADMSELFESKVIRPYVEAWLSARTPNPCVECNRSVKFGHLLGLAEAWGCAKVATGHYARLEDGRLLKASDLDKDQTYFLYSLTARELARVDFPVGGLSKTEVREKARALGLRVADKAESMETCFVPGRDVRGFVESRAESVGSSALSTGEIRDTSGRVRGTHSGLASYTIGQRKGLGVSSPDPLYVVRLEPERNELVVGGGDEVFVHSIVVGALSWTQAAPCGARRAEVRVRHRHPPASAELAPRADGSFSVCFDSPQRAPAPGQAAVFYEGDEVLGGGTILNGGAS
ncbi:MAG: tRNA 2-thiouridine(34) synthase MnmA [Elusimicrobia bacterium RIFOXYD12_FULL_66_9]|nr:MAG: tRNA 2-thiouridine(34) synthase MnmA [Elusimicrobia bacterium RIFOXYD12_FULL_66_9]